MDVDKFFGLCCKVVDYVEFQFGFVVNFFCGEEWFKDFCDYFGRYVCIGIDDLYCNVGFVDCVGMVMYRFGF